MYHFIPFRIRFRNHEDSSRSINVRASYFFLSVHHICHFPRNGSGQRAPCWGRGLSWRIGGSRSGGSEEYRKPWSKSGLSNVEPNEDCPSWNWQSLFIQDLLYQGGHLPSLTLSRDSRAGREGKLHSGARAGFGYALMGGCEHGHAEGRLTRSRHLVYNTVIYSKK